MTDSVGKDRWVDVNKDNLDAPRHHTGWLTMKDFEAIVESNRATEEAGYYFTGNGWRSRRSWICRFLHLPEPATLKYFNPDTGKWHIRCNGYRPDGCMADRER